MIRGNKLYDSVTNQRFYMKGVTYGFETEKVYENYWKPAMHNIRNISSEVNTVRLYRIHPPVHASKYIKAPWLTAAPTPYVTPAPTPPLCECGEHCSSNAETTQFGGYCKPASGCTYLKEGDETPSPPWCCYTCDVQGVKDFEVSTNYDDFMQEMMRLGLYVIVPLTPSGLDPWGGCALFRRGRPEYSGNAMFLIEKDSYHSSFELANLDSSNILTEDDCKALCVQSDLCWAMTWDTKPFGSENGPCVLYKKMDEDSSLIKAPGFNTWAKRMSCYPSCLLSYAMSVMNVFGKYPNTLAYTIGNEVFDSPEAMPSARCIKAFNRDVKTYMMSCNSIRLVPTMYAAADRPLDPLGPSDTNKLKMEYLSCGPWHLRVDMFGMNVYRWCSATEKFEKAYGSMTHALENASCPLILSEFGCDAYQPRNWRQLASLYGSDMSDGWSGGTAYAYGVTGGGGYALFWNGNHVDRKPTHNPGVDKKCQSDGTCNVDIFGAQLGVDGPSADHTPLVGSEFCTLIPVGGDFDHSQKSCPDFNSTEEHEYEFKPEYGIELPRTRWHAQGWVGVNCPAGTIDNIDQKIKDCHRPTQVERECTYGGWCTECTLEHEDPNCSAAMVWLTDHWQSINFQGKPLDGSLCGFQQYLHVQDRICPPPNNTFSCQNNRCVKTPTQTPTTRKPTKFGETWEPTRTPSTGTPNHEGHQPSSSPNIDIRDNVQGNTESPKSDTTWSIIVIILCIAL